MCMPVQFDCRLLQLQLLQQRHMLLSGSMTCISSSKGVELLVHDLRSAKLVF